MGYAIHYSDTDGAILSYTADTYASAGDFLVSALPPNFSSAAYYVKLGTPLYLIQSSTGYAYDATGAHAASADVAAIEPESSDEETPSPSDLSGRGYDFGDVQNGTTIGDVSGSGSESGSGEGEGEGEEEGEEEVVDETVLLGISSGGILVNVILNQDNWVLDNETGKYFRAIASPYITNSTVLYVTGVNRQVLDAHLYWEAENGLLTFTTDSPPNGDVLINGVLSETGDSWTASGVIEAWPGAGLVSKRFRQSLNAQNWSVSLSARGTTGDTKTILTGVGFANAQLLFATPEWTGNTHVVIPSVWVHDEFNRLCYTLTNLSDDDVTVTEVSLRLLYRGTVSNLVEEAQDSAALSGYISNIDIDELE